MGLKLQFCLARSGTWGNTANNGFSITDASGRPPILRIEKIGRPPMHVYPATGNANGAAV